jgi:hypothetical protein
MACILWAGESGFGRRCCSLECCCQVSSAGPLSQGTAPQIVAGERKHSRLPPPVCQAKKNKLCDRPWRCSLERTDAIVQQQQTEESVAHFRPQIKPVNGCCGGGGCRARGHHHEARAELAHVERKVSKSEISSPAWSSLKDAGLMALCTRGVELSPRLTKISSPITDSSA